MYRVYIDGKLHGATYDKIYVADGLEPDTLYTVGVSRVILNKESEIIETTVRTMTQEEGGRVRLIVKRPSALRLQQRVTLKEE